MTSLTSSLKLWRPLAVRTGALYSTSTRRLSDTRTGHDSTIQQGHVSKPGQNRDAASPHQQSAKSGYAASSYDHPHDAASDGSMDKAPRTEKGNPEGIGLVDQVGGQSAHARKVESEGVTSEQAREKASASGMGGKEESTPPGFFAAAKQAIGMDTSTGDVKQNKGAGGGVTGTGTFKDQT